ncbi:MAG: cysteine desulfurase [Gemmatimonadota bacterium]|nr:cysteine desulfurase [Gemmatimonadota bacterium]
MPSPSVLSDWAALRNRFPALSQEVGGKPLVYLDSAATSQKPRCVIEAVSRFYEKDNANVHRGIHELSRRATVAYEEAREKLASFIGAAEAEELVWTRGTTEAINLVAGSWGFANVGEGDEILLSTMEHHSNIVPWQLLAQRTGARLRYIEMDEQGHLAIENLTTLFTDRTRIVAFSHISNALGTVNPVRTIVDLAKSVGALVLIDGAQAVPHRRVNVQELGCDFYTFSGHKMCGPTGIGALWARRDLFESMPPYHGGGEMIHVVGKQTSTWAEIPHKFEAGTPNIAGAIALGVAADFLDEIGFDTIAEHERSVLTYALNRLAELDGIQIYGPKDPSERSGVISFSMGDAHPHDISTILDSEGIAIRAGHHCAQLVMQHFGISATARASFYLYNSTDDVDRLVDGLTLVQEIFGST